MQRRWRDTRRDILNREIARIPEINTEAGINKKKRKRGGKT
jgi:hypothetical protein